MDVQVVLTENDSKLGKRGEIVKVSHGHAHNFLIPHKKALLATAANVKRFEEEKTRQVKSEAEVKARAEVLAKTIEKTSLTIEVLVGDGEKLYGAITSHELQHKLSEMGIQVEKKEIHLEEPIKKLGAFQVPVRLHPQVLANLKIWIVKKKA